MLFEVGHELDHGSSLGMNYLIGETGYITSAVHALASAHPHAVGHAALKAPPPTVIHFLGDRLEIRLTWDDSTGSAPIGFKRAVVTAAEVYVEEFGASYGTVGSEVINIGVGYGEVGGSPMSPAALGESESLQGLTTYATITHALASEGYRFKAANEPRGGQFLVASAEAKALGLVDPTSDGFDGFMGFSTLAGTGYHWNLAGFGTRAHQFDLQSVVEHEISEVMGRVAFGGEVINGLPTYTPLDLFDFRSPGELALSPAGGYFSLDNGRTALGRFNNAVAHGGDIADWASSTIRQSATWGRVAGTQDAYDAFGLPGVDGDVSLSDFAEVAALGYDPLIVASAIVGLCSV
jgi:hypothetical protein